MIFIEHEVRATIHAPIGDVSAVLGCFGDKSWNPGITAGTLIGDETPTVGSVREMRMPEGPRSENASRRWGPGRSFTYAFDGTAPFPVNSSRTPDSATTETWHGQFDVPDDATGRTVEHVNREIVWPRSSRQRHHTSASTTPSTPPT